MAAHRSSVGVRVYAKRGGYLTAYQELVGIAFGSAGREFVHCHGDQVEVRVTRNLMTEALRDPRVIRRTRTSDWVQIPMARPS